MRRGQKEMIGEDNGKTRCNQTTRCYICRNQEPGVTDLAPKHESSAGPRPHECHTGQEVLMCTRSGEPVSGATVSGAAVSGATVHTQKAITPEAHLQKENLNHLHNMKAAWWCDGFRFDSQLGPFCVESSPRVC